MKNTYDIKLRKGLNMGMEMDPKYHTDQFNVSALNWLDEARKGLEMRDSVRIYDCTLREVEQSPHIVLKPDEKFALGKALDALGVYSMQIFPKTSKEDAEVMKALSKEKLNARLTALCRWRKDDIELAKECGAHEVRVEGPGNPWIAECYLGLDEDQLIQKMIDTGKYAQSLGLGVAVGGWDATRAPLSFLEKMYKRLAEMEPTRIQVPDSYGCALPWTEIWLFKKIREWTEDKVDVGVHAHNDFGMALPCSLSAVAGGAAYVEAVMCGYGERSGNAALEEVAVALEVLMGVKTGIKLNKIAYTAELLQELTKVPLATNKPIIGISQYIVYSGLIVDTMDAIIKKTGSFKGYNAIEPELIGRGQRQVLLGKMSGTGSIKRKLKEWNLHATDEQIKKMVQMVKDEAIIRKWSLSDEMVRSIVDTVLNS